MIEKMSGEETFCDRLTLGLERGWVDFGNEPAFLAPYLYAFTSKPYLTTDGVALQRKKFNLNGAPGNDDSGAMSSWYIFSSIGFFPNAGQDLYYFTSPCYPETTINLDDGRSLKLTARNLSDTNKYIQSITINGKPYKSTMFSHDVILQGGEIVFEMGATPVDYAKETAAAVESVDKVSDPVNLDDTGCDEWAHFSSSAQINRKAGVTQTAVAPDGLSGGLQSGVLDGGFPGLSWKKGTPRNTAAGHRGYVWSGEGIEIPVRLTGGDARAELFVTNLNGPGVLEVLDGKSNLLAQTQINPGPGGDRTYNRVGVRLSSGGPETFTLRLLADPEGKDEDGQVGVSAVTLENLAPCVVTFDAMEGGATPNQTVCKGAKS